MYAGAHGLPYAEMLKRHEKLAYYAHLASVSKMTVKFRTAKMMRARNNPGEIAHAMGVHPTVDDEDEESDALSHPQGLRQRRNVGSIRRLQVEFPPTELPACTLKPA